jgi:protein farnesyltransferase subunit beta
MAASSATRRAPPLPYPDDGLPTETSRTQADTEDVLLGHFPASGATPTLNMEMHKQWLARNLIQGFPARYQAYDCSQPWLSYWTLQAFCAIGIGMDPASSQRCARRRSHAVWSALSQALVGSSTRS